MSVGIVVLLVVAVILLFKVAAGVLTDNKEYDGNCGCDGYCGENCKCKDK